MQGLFWDSRLPRRLPSDDSLSSDIQTTEGSKIQSLIRHLARLTITDPGANIGFSAWTDSVRADPMRFDCHS